MVEAFRSCCPPLGPSHQICKTHTQKYLLSISKSIHMHVYMYCNVYILLEYRDKQKIYLAVQYHAVSMGTCLGHVILDVLNLHNTCMYMFLMKDEKEERKKQTRSNKQTRQSNTAHPRQSLFLEKMSCLRWDSNPRHSIL